MSTPLPPGYEGFLPEGSQHSTTSGLSAARSLAYGGADVSPKPARSHQQQNAQYDEAEPIDSDGDGGYDYYHDEHTNNTHINNNEGTDDGSNEALARAHAELLAAQRALLQQQMAAAARGNQQQLHQNQKSHRQQQQQQTAAAPKHLDDARISTQYPPTAAGRLHVGADLATPMRGKGQHTTDAHDANGHGTGAGSDWDAIVFRMARDRSPRAARSPRRRDAASHSPANSSTSGVMFGDGSTLGGEEGNNNGNRQPRVLLEGSSVKNMPYDYIAPASSGGSGAPHPQVGGSNSPIANQQRARQHRNSGGSAAFESSFEADAAAANDDLLTAATVFFVGSRGGVAPATSAGLHLSPQSILRRRGSSASSAADGTESPTRRSLSRAKEAAELISGGASPVAIMGVNNSKSHHAQHSQNGHPLSSSHRSHHVAGVSVKNMSYDFVTPHDEEGQTEYRPDRRENTATTTINGAGGGGSTLPSPTVYGSAGSGGGGRSPYGARRASSRSRSPSYGPSSSQLLREMVASAAAGHIPDRAAPSLEAVTVGGVTVTNEPYDFVGPVLDVGGEGSGQFASQGFLNEPPRSAAASRFGGGAAGGTHAAAVSSSSTSAAPTPKTAPMASSQRNQPHDYAEPADAGVEGDRTSPLAKVSSKAYAAAMAGAGGAVFKAPSPLASASSNAATPMAANGRPAVASATSPQRRRSGSPAVDAILSERRTHNGTNATSRVTIVVDDDEDEDEDALIYAHLLRKQQQQKQQQQQPTRATSMTRMIAEIMSPATPRGADSSGNAGGGPSNAVAGNDAFGASSLQQQQLPHRFADPYMNFNNAAEGTVEEEEDGPAGGTPSVRAARIQTQYANGAAMRRHEDELERRSLGASPPPPTTQSSVGSSSAAMGALGDGSATPHTPRQHHHHQHSQYSQSLHHSSGRFRSPEQRPHVDICQVVSSVPFETTPQRMMGLGGGNESRSNTGGAGFAGYVSPQRRIISAGSAGASAETQALLDTARTTVAMLTEELVGLRREHAQLQRAYAEQGRVAASVKKTAAHSSGLHHQLDAFAAELERERGLRLAAEESLRTAKAKGDASAAAEAKLKRERAALSERLAASEQEVLAVKVTAKSAIDQLAAALRLATEGHMQA